MGFMDSLKKTFLYTGGSDNKEPNKREESAVEEKNKPRLNIGNPMQRIRDVKDSTINAFKNSTSTSKPVMSDYTKSLIYESMHNIVESRLRKGKPLVEAKLLYKRFLEDGVTDEALYSDVDIEYIKELVKHIRELRSFKDTRESSREAVVERIKESKYLLNIIEVLDVDYGYNMMSYFCELSYVICGYSYRGRDNKFSNVLSSKIPHFYINIDDSTFILLNEVKSLISNDSSLIDKKNYIASKISPLLLRYVTINNVPFEVLHTVLTTFNNLNVLSSINTQSIILPVDGSVTIIGEVVEQFSEEDIQAKMFSGIQNDVNPITTLKRESVFSNVYSELADPRKPDVTIEELEEAIEDINKMVEIEEFELSPSEFKIFSTIKHRLRMMKGGED